MGAESGDRGGKETAGAGKDMASRCIYMLICIHMYSSGNGVAKEAAQATANGGSNTCAPCGRQQRTWGAKARA